ncbi:MAG: hypothetical protein KAS30_01605 [Candidatus Diapherotrites archaeon]|nr:hypothetical protein [Candidatus Diapherotrites archaeon]
MNITVFMLSERLDIPIMKLEDYKKSLCIESSKMSYAEAFKIYFCYTLEFGLGFLRTDTIRATESIFKTGSLICKKMCFMTSEGEEAEIDIKGIFDNFENLKLEGE